MVALMTPRGALGDPPGRLLPIVRVGDCEFHLALEAMTSVPASSLREPVGSIAPYRGQITRALDWLFTGV
jgi:hypothetical protein